MTGLEVADVNIKVAGVEMPPNGQEAQLFIAKGYRYIV